MLLEGAFFCKESVVEEAMIKVGRFVRVASAKMKTSSTACVHTFNWGGLGSLLILNTKWEDAAIHERNTSTNASM
jgi:hypothetical protein